MSFLTSLRFKIPLAIRVNKNKWLLVAAIFHVALTISIFFLGQTQILPDLFDPNGFGKFASDSREYLGEVEGLAEILRDEGIVVWLHSPSQQWHNKVIALSFAVSTPLLGVNILSAELYNLACYLVILVLVFIVGSEIFNRETGLMAAAFIALLPSFLLHTTQLLKDGLFMSGFLVLILVSVRWLYRKHSPASALVHALIAVLVVNMLGMIRLGWPHVYMSMVVFSALGLFVRMKIKREIMLWNLIGSTLVVGATVVLMVPHFQTLVASYRIPSSPVSESKPLQEGAVGISEGNSIQDDGSALHVPDTSHAAADNLWVSVTFLADSASQIVGVMRQGFVDMYPHSGSTIDAHYRITNMKSLVYYLPRATQIGFFAPFPNMWIGQGEKLGLSARLLSGIETLAMYLVYFLAVLGIWRERRGPSVWYLFIVIILGVVSMGLVVVVIGALYRMRYVYWMLMFLLGAGGLQGILNILFGQILVVD